MSNDGMWQPPQGGATPPPPPSRPEPVPPPSAPPAFGPPPSVAPPGPPPTGLGASGPEAPLVPNEAPASSGSKGKLVAIVVGVLVLVAAGIFAITRLGGDSAAGGADSPEAAGQAILDAISDEDLLGAVDVLLPGERDTFRQPLSDLAAELTRLDVLSDDASLSDVGGVDVVFSDTEVGTFPTNVDDIVNLELTGAVSVSVDGEALPIGDIVYDNVPDADPTEATLDATPAMDFNVPVTAVRKDDRWYVSVFYTAAEGARAFAGFDIPAQGIVPTGGDSPEDAFDAFLDGVEALDLQAMIAALNPNEAEALQRYAPAFLDDAQREIDTAGVEVTLDEADYAVEGDGDRRSISITYLSGAITAEGETVEFEYEGGCVRMTVPGEDVIDSCQLEEPSMTDVLGPDAEILGGLIDDFEAAFADYEDPGIIVEQVDGTWYLSPLATGFEQMLEVLRALDREEIETLGDSIADVFDDLMTDLSGGGLDIPSEILEDDDADDIIVAPEITIPDLTIPDMTIPEFTVPPVDDGSSDPAAGDECYAAQNGTDAAACFEALIATGELAPSAVPVYLRAPQCGLADSYWDGELFSQDDATFTTTIGAAAPCFQGLVTDGTLDEFDLPLELSNPECLEGRNWYTASGEDEEYLDRVIACAYG